VASRQTTRTDALRIYRPKVCGVTRVPERYCASGRDSLSEPRDPGRPDRVEHVDAEGDVDEEVFWVALKRRMKNQDCELGKYHEMLN